MIQTSTRADRRLVARAVQKSTKLDRKAFAIANRKLVAEGRPQKGPAERKPPRPGSLEHLLLAQDTNQLGQFTEEQLAPFLRELRRRAHIITKRKIKQQFGVGKYWPAGKHKNCDKRGISPKRVFSVTDGDGLTYEARYDLPLPSEAAA